MIREGFELMCRDQFNRIEVVDPNQPAIQFVLFYFPSVEKGGAVYIMTNTYHTVFYTGVTSDLITRIYQHKTKHYPKSFSARYNIQKLVYFEAFHSIEEAIEREKQVKKYRREKKIALIEGMNQHWNDLYEGLE
ncbi:MAG: GIY-YIG nuclease family protein [Cyclobacteriaceae bacterium]